MDTSILQSPLSLNKAIKYQSGSVVSKELFRHKSATITLFAFDKDQGLSEHKTSYNAFVYLIDGKGIFTIGGIEHILNKGDIIQMPENTPHAIKANQRFKMLLVMVKK